MKDKRPRQPSHISLYSQACLDALVKAGLAERISLGGACGGFHYIDYRATYNVNTSWLGLLIEKQKQEVIEVLATTLATFGSVNIRAWGDVVSIELSQDNKTVFSFQIAASTAILEEPILAG